MTKRRDPDLNLPNHPEPEVWRLREELYMARETIIMLMGSEISDILMSYHYCSSEQECWDWRDVAADKIVQFAQLRPPQEMGDYDGLCSRAVCPLCGGSSANRYIRGFAFTEGLLRHLLGSYNVHQCRVFGAADAMAREYRQRNFPWTPNP